MKKRILFFLILSLGLTLVSSCENGKDEKTSTDIDGDWLVTCIITSCGNATVSNTITVSDGKFDAEIGSYTEAHPYYPQTQSVSIQGTLIIVSSNGIEASGNEFLSGSACNGGNGFYGIFNSTKKPISGDSPSYWGNIHWERK